MEETTDLVVDGSRERIPRSRRPRATIAWHHIMNDTITASLVDAVIDRMPDVQRFDPEHGRLGDLYGILLGEQKVAHRALGQWPHPLAACYEWLTQQVAEIKDIDGIVEVRNGSGGLERRVGADTSVFQLGLKRNVAGSLERASATVSLGRADVSRPDSVVVLPEWGRNGRSAPLAHMSPTLEALAGLLHRWDAELA